MTTDPIGSGRSTSDYPKSAGTDKGPIDQNAACDDYRGSGFDRGHMVPRSAMNRSQTAIVNTFFLTNMTPQRPNVNQGVGRYLRTGAHHLRECV